MSNPIDEHFKKGLESLEVKPRADLWQQKIAPQVQPKEKKVVLWYRAAAVIILLLSGWYSVNYISNYTPSNKIQWHQQPVVVQPVEKETIELPNNTIEETVAEDVANNSIPVTAPKNATTKKQVAKNVTKEVSPKSTASQELVEEQIIEESLAATEVKKPVYKVKLHVSSLDIEDAVAVEETPAETNGNVKDYAKNQWDNIKNGEKLEAPPKDWFSLPKLAVRFEGNPIKGVLGQ